MAQEEARGDDNPIIRIIIHRACQCQAVVELRVHGIR
jgi:hypothetical protein